MSSNHKHPYITSDRHICGGEPIIKGTRFPVRSLIFYILKEGMLPEELIREFPQLSYASIYDAISYYYDHRQKIEKILREHESKTVSR